MSIQSEINRIKNHISSSYAAVAQKGGTIPSVQNSANLATAITSISQGQGSSIITNGKLENYYSIGLDIPKGTYVELVNGDPTIRPNKIVEVSGIPTTNYSTISGSPSLVNYIKVLSNGNILVINQMDVNLITWTIGSISTDGFTTLYSGNITIERTITASTQAVRIMTFEDFGNNYIVVAYNTNDGNYIQLLKINNQSEVQLLSQIIKLGNYRFIGKPSVYEYGEDIIFVQQKSLNTPYTSNSQFGYIFKLYNLTDDVLTEKANLEVRSPFVDSYSPTLHCKLLYSPIENTVLFLGNRYGYDDGNWSSSQNFPGTHIRLLTVENNTLSLQGYGYCLSGFYFNNLGNKQGTSMLLRVGNNYLYSKNNSFTLNRITDTMLTGLTTLNADTLLTPQEIYTNTTMPTNNSILIKLSNTKLLCMGSVYDSTYQTNRTTGLILLLDNNQTPTTEYSHSDFIQGVSVSRYNIGNLYHIIRSSSNDLIFVDQAGIIYFVKDEIHTPAVQPLTNYANFLGLTNATLTSETANQVWVLND